MAKGRAWVLWLGVGLILSGAGDVNGQTGVLRGEVRDGTTGALLLDAEVRVIGTGLRTGTDAQGRFRFPLLTGVEYDVEAVRIGFAPERRRVRVEERGTEITLSLGPAPVHIPAVEVIGRSRGALERIAGSAAVVTQAQLAAALPLSGNEVLRTVAGVHVQEEEGLGLRANVGIRGLDPNRSSTVLMLEDGVPIALNPYSEPEMYYSPPIDRMERVEVVKGSGSILFGPQTIGGVINYVTPGAPLTPQGAVSVQGGSGGLLRLNANYGGTWQNVGARVGVMHNRMDDLRGLFANVNDVTGRVGFHIGGRSQMGLKLSAYDEQSNATYVGLTEAMFRDAPNQHPAPDDRMRLRRYAVSATHDLQVTPGASLRTTAYAYTTTRNWQRQDYGYSADGSRVVLQPTTGNRNRSFEVIGVEPRLQWNHSLLGLTGELDAGVRAQWESAEDAHINGSTPTARTGVVRDYEVRQGRAFAGFLQNRFHLTDRFQVTPGVRLESFDFERNILRTRVRRVDPVTGAVTRLPEDVDIRSGDSVLELIPGLGVTWNAGERLTLFSGVHRGFAPPQVKTAFVYDDATVPLGGPVGELVSLQLDAERSVNVELGARSMPFAGVSAEATAFLLDFSNQIIAPSLSGGTAAQVAFANQGETRHAGVESAVAVDWGMLAGWPFAVITEVKHTHVKATFSADRLIRTPAGDTVNVRGNRLPYAPANLWHLAVSVNHPAGVGLRLDGTRIDEQFADNFQTIDAPATGRNGLIPSYSVWNVSGSYRLSRRPISLTGSVKNAFDAMYIVSRRPEGIKPGNPRMVQLGARVGF